ncbi:CoA transferase [Streptomyces sp. NPDC057743]|uniref:CoA transferase n=1 Tax=Streptomyces sp. NPDC057743 TaxID=3346236 RepID=UPI00367689BB
MPVPSAPRLTERLTAALAAPAVDDAFDPHRELADVLAGIGMTPEETGGAITFHGADPIVPSALRLGAASALALVTKSAVAAAIWRDRGGAGQDIAMDLRRGPRRLAPISEPGRWERLNGYPPATPAIVGDGVTIGFYRTADDRWIMPANFYPKLSLAATKLLGIPDDASAAAAAIATWRGADLEAAAEEAGTVLPMVRTTAELMAEPQYRDVLAELPLIEIEKIGDSDPEPFPAGATQPLHGIRALGMAHVIAGASAGRALALHGADVLNLWRPFELEHDTLYCTANVGMRQATLDPYGTEGAAAVRELLRGADVFFANRRPGYLTKIGLTAEEAAALRPGIVHATVSLHGRTGPWAGRIGFDQVAGAVSGMLMFEGDEGRPALPPVGVINDNICGWLLAAGIGRALQRRAVEGGSYRVHISLTRVALWAVSMGVFDKDYARKTAGTPGPHENHPLETFTADTPMGHYQGVTDQVVMSATPGRYRTVLSHRGADRPAWLPRP